MSWQDNLRVSASIFFLLCYFKNKKVQPRLHRNAHLRKSKFYSASFDKHTSSCFLLLAEMSHLAKEFTLMNRDHLISTHAADKHTLGVMWDKLFTAS